jgi:hypothetical protein
MTGPTNLSEPVSSAFKRGCLMVFSQRLNSRNGATSDVRKVDQVTENANIEAKSPSHRFCVAPMMEG